MWFDKIHQALLLLDYYANRKMQPEHNDSYTNRIICMLYILTHNTAPNMTMID